VRIQSLSRWLQPSGFLLLAFFPLITYGLDSKQDPLVHQVTAYRDTYGVPHIVSTRDSRSLRIGLGEQRQDQSLDEMNCSLHFLLGH